MISSSTSRRSTLHYFPLLNLGYILGDNTLGEATGTLSHWRRVNARHARSLIDFIDIVFCIYDCVDHPCS